MLLQHFDFFRYSRHFSHLNFVFVVFFAAALFFQIPKPKVSSLHFVLICAGILPRLIEKMDLVLLFFLFNLIV